MEQEELDKRRVEFVFNAKQCFNGTAGKLVLAELKSEYVDSTALRETDALTHYRLGQKELVQMLMSYVDSPEDLDDINVISTGGDDL